MHKKILFINPTIFSAYHGSQPHYGLGCLAAILKNKGHEVKILDYVGFRNLPLIEDFIEKEFYPDMIGFTCYSSTWELVNEQIKQVKKYNLPILLGGPHTACYKDDLLNYKDVNYIVIGESEDVICDVVEKAELNDTPEIIYGIPPDVNKIPFPDFSVFVGKEKIDRYLVQTSRGCPFNCSFCIVEVTNTRKWRPRKIEDVLSEIQIAVKEYPKIEDIYIIDDIFTLHLKRAKELLRQYLKLGLSQRLIISSVRADSVDKELIELLIKAGTMYLALGIEHANREVFDAVGKKETFDEIENAIELFNKEKIFFNCYMIVGLPYDNFERTKESIQFLRRTKPNLIIWSMVAPYKGTKVRSYFDEHGTVFNEEQFNFAEDDLIIDPSVETPDFSREERKKAYFMARLATCSYDWRKPWIVIRRIPQIIKYGLIWEFITGIIWGFGIRARRVIRKRRITKSLQNQTMN